jgi:hypothetical protein
MRDASFLYLIYVIFYAIYREAKDEPQDQATDGT